jgi:hypothetical protein
MFYKGLFKIYDFQTNYQKITGLILIEYKITFELVIYLNYKIKILYIIFRIKKIRIN